MSQYIGVTFITPYLFDLFPNTTQLKTFSDVSVDRVKYLSDLEQNIAAAKDDKKALKSLTSQMKWAEFFWKGLKPGQAVPKSMFVKFLVFKTGKTSLITVGMVSLYFSLRWALVGPTAAESDGHIL
ncbi:MAG: hypothetical protein KA715_10700 [Xanthomonadaceae bacterium]|nr:hypothetical protein [Xanthomonadaceae bacterium]